MADMGWDLGATMARARREGERVVERIAHEMGALVGRSAIALPLDLDAWRHEVRVLADRTLRDLEVRAANLVDAVERRLEATSEMVLRRFSAATQSELDFLGRRIATLEKRLRSLEKTVRVRSRVVASQESP